MDIINKTFGRLTVIKRNGSDKHGKSLWLCHCDCGNEVIIIGQNLKNGVTRSCGCLQKELLTKKNITHGMTYTKLYVDWIQMRKRCKNKKNKSYKNYGARGITVCDRWLKFENFYRDMGDKPEGLTLERIDNNGNYEPNNCKWATRKVQANNSRRNVIIEYLGQKKNIAQWAKDLGIKYNTLVQRLQRHWPIKKALGI